MFETVRSLAAPAVMQRLTLLVNHLLTSEPIAMNRLRPHVGRRIHLQIAGWPSWLPAWPVLDFRITPAGLLEWCGDADSLASAELPETADLQLVVEAANPAVALLHGMAGRRPRVSISGDAVLATDVDWLFENLRWDFEDDLARVVGAAPARELSRLAGWIGGGIREAARLAARVVPGTSETPPRERGVPDRP